MSCIPPLNDTLVFALARAVDDAGPDRTREPSHSDLEFIFQRSAVTAGDPKTKGQTVGKAKRVRSVLSWALSNDPMAGRNCVARLLSTLRAFGGFRTSSPNYISEEAVQALQDAFSAEGFVLGADGELSPKVLDNLSGLELTAALLAYVRRAQRGAEDAALLTGAGKDLVEATAAHVLREVYSVQEAPHQFSVLLGQAFAAVGLRTTEDREKPGESPQQRLQRHLFGAACAINTLRNKEGAGHGHPWLPRVTAEEARAAVQIMGTVAELMLSAMAARK